MIGTRDVRTPFRDKGRRIRKLAAAHARSMRQKRNVTLDANVLISYVISKRDDTIVKKVVTKSVNDDRLMLTDVIYGECMRYGDKKGARASREEISGKLRAISGEIIDISPVPSNEELAKRYKIRDADDLKILYSVEMTNSVILVTLDDDFTDVQGLKAEIMRPGEYLDDKRRPFRRRR